MKKAIKYGLILGIIAILSFIYYLYPKDLDKSNERFKVVENIQDESIDSFKVIEKQEPQKTQNRTDPTDFVEITQKKEPLPASKKLEVAFIPQAPFKNWSEPWQNACEEAALLTLHHYIQGNSAIPNEQAKQEILAMIAWQMTYFGSHKDLDMSEVAIMAEKYLGYKDVEVIYNIEIKNIKREIADGNPVLIPVAGQVLNNPNYTPPGPVYHNLVIIGYTENKIITNDPGTRNGSSFEYDYDNFYESIHDYSEGTSYSNSEKILKGRKAMLVISNN